jgi:hypothetical protein
MKIFFLFSILMLNTLILENRVMAQSDPSEIKVGGIPVLRSSTLASNENFYQGLDQVNKVAKLYPMEQLPYRTIFIANAFHGCNQKGDIWINFAATEKSILNHLVNTKTSCEAQTSSVDSVDASISNLKLFIRQRFGTKAEMSPALTSKKDFLKGLTQLVIAFDEAQTEFGKIHSVFVGESELITPNALWLHHQSTTDHMRSQIQKFKSTGAPLSRAAAQTQDR